MYVTSKQLVISKNSSDIFYPGMLRVKILRKESYWFNGVGSVVRSCSLGKTISLIPGLFFSFKNSYPGYLQWICTGQDLKTRYLVAFFFNKVNYENVSTNNYTLDEIEVKWVWCLWIVILVFFIQLYSLKLCKCHECVSYSISVILSCSLLYFYYYC